MVVEITAMNEGVGVFIFGPGDGERATWNDGVDLEPIVCRSNPDHQRGGRRTTVLSVEVSEKALQKHVVWTWQSDCLIRRSVAEYLEHAGVRGFETREARLTVRGVEREHDFVELVVTGWGGIAGAASGVSLLDECPDCGLLLYSGVQHWDALVDWRQWDGSDMFIVWPLPRYTLVTAGPATLLSKGGFAGFALTPLADMKPTSQLSPGRVSDWLPNRIVLKKGIPPNIV